jgi:hypothetical protein
MYIKTGPSGSVFLIYRKILSDNKFFLKIQNCGAQDKFSLSDLHFFNFLTLLEEKIISIIIANPLFGFSYPQTFASFPIIAPGMQGSRQGYSFLEDRISNHIIPHAQDR